MQFKSTAEGVLTYVEFALSCRFFILSLNLNIYLFDKLYNTIQYKTIQYNTIQRVYKLGSGKKPVGLIQIRFPTDVNCNECKLR